VPDALPLLELYTRRRSVVMESRESGPTVPARGRQLPPPQVRMDRAVGHKPACCRGPRGRDQGVMSDSMANP
jgi:hypothetical protein